jgi:hypothetical protein
MTVRKMVIEIVVDAVRRLSNRSLIVGRARLIRDGFFSAIMGVVIMIAASD